MKSPIHPNGKFSQIARWLGCLPLLLCWSIGNATPGAVVHTQDGAVRGTQQQSMLEFLGIPYAAPPVGDLRWRAPRPAHPWPGVRDATQFAPHCAQNSLAIGTYPGFGVATQNEDCLYLNVFVPTRTPAWVERTGLPVMFWIHGGYLDYGESDYYDPSALVAEGVIVVTINYRLGLLGFLVHPALACAISASRKQSVATIAVRPEAEERRASANRSLSAANVAFRAGRGIQLAAPRC
jgi:hypothetical protein